MLRFERWESVMPKGRLPMWDKSILTSQTTCVTVNVLGKAELGTAGEQPDKKNLVQIIGTRCSGRKTKHFPSLP